MPKLNRQPATTQPGYRPIYDSLRARILGGELRPGERVPATRELARDLGVSRGVVVAAYRELVCEGYLRARVGHGTWVNDDPPDSHLTVEQAPSPRAGVPAAVPRLSPLARNALTIDFGGDGRWRSENRSDAISFSLDSVVVDRHSADSWNRLFQSRLRQTPEGIPPADDSPELRQALAGYLHRSRGISAEPDQILIFASAGQCIDLVGRALLQPGSTALMEDPGRRHTRLAFEAAGARLIACPVDRDGMDVMRSTAGTDAFRRTGPRMAELAYVTPSHQFPTGEVMSPERRRGLLAWASAAGAIIVEDDRDGELRYEGLPLPAIHAMSTDGRVIYIGTISRTFRAEMRLGYAVLPPSLVQPIAVLRSLVGSSAPIANQAVLADFILGEHYDRHLRRLQQQTMARRRILLDSLEDSFGEELEITGASAGLHVVAWFRESRESEVEEKLLAAAREIGVEVSPLSPHWLTPPSRLGFALGYAGLSEPEILRGVYRFAMAWHSTRRRNGRAGLFSVQRMAPRVGPTAVGTELEEHEDCR